jgi:hypothetical protein
MQKLMPIDGREFGVLSADIEYAAKPLDVIAPRRNAEVNPNPQTVLLECVRLAFYSQASQDVE